MTPETPTAPGTEFTVLFGQDQDAPAALAAADLPAWIEDNLGGALGGLPEATRKAAVREITASAASLMNVNLIDVLVAGWRTWETVTSAARRTLAGGSTELLPLLTHQITETSDPYVTVLVDGHRVATLQLNVSIVCQVETVQAQISAGRLVAIESGRCDITATVAIEGAGRTSSLAAFELPGVIPFGRGLRLLPAHEYPGAGQHGKHRKGISSTAGAA